MADVISTAAAAVQSSHQKGYIRTMEITRTSRTFVRNGDLGVDVHLTLEEAKRIRAALSDLDGEDLDNYGGILERLRKAIPQQWG